MMPHIHHLLDLFLLMILSAAAYAEENGFKIEIEEGYFEAGKMVLRSFRILEC